MFTSMTLTNPASEYSNPPSKSFVFYDQEFLDGTRHVIYPWNQSKISNLKSSSPRICPWGQSKILASKISNRMTPVSMRVDILSRRFWLVKK